MGWIIAGIILSIILFVVLGLSIKEENWKLRKRQILSLAGLLVAIFGCFTTISANRVGVMYDPFKGGVQESLLQEGFKTKMPYVKIYQLNTEIKELSFEGVTVQTNDSQWVSTVLQVQVQIDKNNAFAYFQKYRNKSFDDISNVIKSTVQKELETISTQYNIMEILGEKRTDIVNETLINIQKELIKDGIIVQRFVLVDTDAGDTIEAAISKEAAAKKEAEAAKWLKEKATEEGNAKVIAAQKDKEAYDLLTRSLTPEILQSKKLDILKEYVAKGGQFPKVIGGNNIFDITSLLGE